MTGYEAYCLFSSLKMHFNTEYYDYFKYNGKIKYSGERYEKRNDKFIFQSLAKKPNSYNLVLSNILNDASIWVTDCMTNEAKKICLEWEKVQQSLLYVYKKDLEKLDSDFNRNFIIESRSNYPMIINLMHQKIITMETVIIIDKISNFLEKVDKKITERIIWPNVYFKIKKYSPFIHIDNQIYKKVTVDIFS